MEKYNVQEEEHQQEVEQQQPKKKFQCPHCEKEYVYEKSCKKHIDVCKKKPSPPPENRRTTLSEPIPSNVPAKVESVEAAKERLNKFIKVKTTLERAVNEDERKEIRAAIELVQREIDRAYPLLPKDYRDMLTPWDKKVVDDHIYDFDLGTKVGEGEDAESRTNMQTPKYTTRSIVSNPASEEVVQDILNLNLLMLKGHVLQRLIKQDARLEGKLGRQSFMPATRSRAMLCLSLFYKCQQTKSEKWLIHQHSLNHLGSILNTKG